MFPLAFAFMAIALCSTRSLKLAAKGGLVMVLFFAVLAGPLVAALSQQKHRLTFGDSGRINYAMFVSPGGAPRNWQGEPQFGITAVHPTRKLLSDPPVYEFAKPIGGTFPPWYDPSYWEEGRVPVLSLKAQVRVVIGHLLSYAELLLHQQNCLLAALLALFMVARRNAIAELGKMWPLLLMCCARAGAVHAGACGNVLHRRLCCNFLADSLQYFPRALAARPVLRILAPGCFWRDADLGGG